MLRKQHEKRPTCAEILRHPWILKHLNQHNDVFSGYLSATAVQNNLRSPFGFSMIGLLPRPSILETVLSAVSRS